MREIVWPPVQQLSISILDKLSIIDGFIPLRSQLANYSGEDVMPLRAEERTATENKMFSSN